LCKGNGQGDELQPCKSISTTANIFPFLCSVESEQSFHFISLTDRQVHTPLTMLHVE
jgi:hypothetical protein